MCTHWSWRGDAALPFEPPASRAAAGAPGAPGAQPPDPRRGARPAQRRTGVVAAHATPADRLTAAAAALRLPNVGERANEAVSALGERWLDALVRIEDHPAAGDVTGLRLHPPKAGCLPSRRDQSRRRRGLGATPSAAKGAAKAALFRAVHPERGGGSLPAPLPAQTRGVDSQACGRTATGTPAFEHDAGRGKRQKQRQKGGAVLLPLQADPESCATGGKSPARLAPARGVRPSTPRCAPPASFARCGRSLRPAPRPGARSPVRWSSSLRRARPAFDGAIPSRRCPLRCGSGFRTPPPGGLDGVPGSCRYPLRLGGTRR